MVVKFLHGWSYDSACWQNTSIPSQVLTNNYKYNILIAWSLGVLQAMQIAVREPQNVQALVLIAATPSFCNRDNWSHGCSAAVFTSFQRGLRQPLRLLNRFDKLVMHGDAFACTIPRNTEPSKLADGLEYLKNTDLRKKLPQQPCLLLHGCHDVITPIAAARWLAKAMPQAVLHEIPTAGHAPMWTHATECNHVLDDFCELLEKN